MGEEFLALSQRYPGKLHALNANVTEEHTITAAVEKIIEEAGALHGMVVNAGRTHHKAALDFTKEEIENLFNVNLFGAFYTARAAARAFIKLGIKGSIVFTASMASYRPNKASSTFRKDYRLMLPLLICETESTLHPIRCLKSGRSQHDSYPCYGMGSIRYSREQCFSGPSKDRHDILGAPAAGLGAAAEVLWRIS